MSLASPNKIHLGLITQDLSQETLFKDALREFGGGYVHTAKDHLEMSSKLKLQKIDLMIYDCPDNETGAGAQALVNFFRGQYQYKTIPIGLFYPQAKIEMKFLITDPRVRGFSKAFGATLPLLTLFPFIDPKNSQIGEPLAQDWIQTEFLASVRGKIGHETQFTPTLASDDDLHTSFLCQVNQEVRTHLAWFKIAARILERTEDGFVQIFQGIPHDDIAEISQNILDQITTDFQDKLISELITRGALFFPDLEQMSPHDRKQIRANSRSTAHVFQSEQIAILLEMIRYF